MAHSRPTLSSPSHPLPLSCSFPSYPLPLLPPTHPLLLPPFHSFTCPDPLFYVLVLKLPLTVLVAITNCQAKYHNVIFCFVRILKCSRPCTARWINYHLLRYVGSWLDTFILETSFSYSLNRYIVEYQLTVTVFVPADGSDIHSYLKLSTTATGRRGGLMASALDS